jgi:hypothetical protein
MTDTPAHRPRFIILLSVLGVVQGLFALLLGIFLVVDYDDVELLAKVNNSDVVDGHQITENMLLTAGIIAIALAVVVIIGAIALSRGSEFGRWVVALGSIAIAAQGLWSLVALHGEQQFSAAFSLAFGVFTVWYLFSNDQARAYFHEV